MVTRNKNGQSMGNVLDMDIICKMKRLEISISKGKAKSRNGGNAVSFCQDTGSETFTSPHTLPFSSCRLFHWPRWVRARALALSCCRLTGGDEAGIG